MPISNRVLAKPRDNKIMFGRNIGPLIDALNNLEEGPVTGQRDTATIAKFIDARILGSPQRDGENWRWYYSWEQVGQTAAGYGNLATIGNGFSGDAGTPATRALNDLEEINGTSGVTGVGINLDNLPADDDGTALFELQPIPEGTPVLIRAKVLPDGTVEFRFSAPNGIDGTCPT